MGISADIVVLNPDHRLFSVFTEIPILTQSLAMALDVIIGRNPQYNPGDYLAAEGRIVPFTIRLPLWGPIQRVLADAKVLAIELRIEAKSEKNRLIVNGSNFQTILNHVVSPFFISFFEDYRPWITQNFPSYEQWPKVFNFYRVVRNAFAHGGTLNINSPSAVVVEWQGQKYSYNDNNRKIIGTDLVFADFIFLMLDASKELDDLGCPSRSR